jgi:hypothetical protein
MQVIRGKVAQHLQVSQPGVPGKPPGGAYLYYLASNRRSQGCLYFECNSDRIEYQTYHGEQADVGLEGEKPEK